MSVNQRTQLTVQPWRPTTSPSPVSEGADKASPVTTPLTTDVVAHNTTREFQRLHATIDSLVDAAEQVTDVAPRSPLIGMIRYATGAWATTLGAEGLYVYKTAGWTFIV